MYHRDYNEPVRADNNGEKIDFENKGWTSAYIHKEYPKWVNGVIVQTKRDQEILLGKQEKVTLVKEKVLIDASGKIEVAENFPYCIYGRDDKMIEGMEFKTWTEAQKAQGELNDKNPGHRAGKKSE